MLTMRRLTPKTWYLATTPPMAWLSRSPPTYVTSAVSSASAVPEPTTLAMVSLVLMGLMARRKERCA
ncbi:PEP-CTERM sorting domain-containing protein [Adhaeretor mobilis]|uniref:PEP-CTERM sorting domain-containing protein n=1 Tax=Adhaeretor mobilis TaxID=1930276 RepID=UPI0036F4A9EF